MVNGVLDREGVDAVLNDLDEYAVEEALKIQEAHGGEVTIVSMGPERAVETIRKALSMGADAGIHIVDDALSGSDALATSAVLAGVLKDRGFDLIIFGSESTDARMSVVPAMVSERLGLPQLTFAQKVDVNGGTITIERQTDYGFDSVEASSPVVVSVVEKINEPRYPSLKGIMGAKKKPQDVKSLGDIGLGAGDVGEAGAKTKVVGIETPPARTAGQVVKDEGNGAQVIFDYLVEKKLI
jgi:electron transfer flavoprotein beta subunit